MPTKVWTTATRLNRKHFLSAPGPVWPDWAIFVKLLVTNLVLAEVDQIFAGSLCYLESNQLLSKNCSSYFLDKYYKIWATFYSNIWSHWGQPRRSG